MGKSLTRKILEAHRVTGTVAPGEEIGLRIDQTLTQDATGTVAYLQFESLGMGRVKTELSVSYVDHNTIQVGFENADDHAYLQTVAARHGVVYSKPGNGICHQVHLERFGIPGKTLVGSDSHTPTAGGIGMIAIGAGGLDVAVAMGGGAFFIPCPRVCKINLTGRVKPWCSAKDVALKMLELFSVKGNVGVVLEYGGPGVETLSVPERATITNMGAEMGVTTSLFPSDDQTRVFLKAQGREQGWVALHADDAAEYDRVIDLDLGAVEPLAAAPHSPGNVIRVADLKAVKVDQVIVGSCTNSSYKDVATVARILKNRKVHRDVSFAVAPGSRQVLQMAARDGHLADLLDSGARLLEAACGFCIGNSQSPKTDAVSVRTSNRNFEGRSGTPSANVYLVSPEVAAVAAVTGALVDPRESGIEYPVVDMPSEFWVDDSLFVFPADVSESTPVVRGPNISNPPSCDPLPESVAGRVMIKVGDKITTDHIMPAGSRLKYRSNIPRYSEFVFEPVDPEFPARALKAKGEGVHSVIVAGESYGQGSSREHAALCPMYLGVKAVIAKSVERIHAANLVNFGIACFTFADPADYDALEAGDEVVLSDVRKKLLSGESVSLWNKTRNTKIALACTYSSRQKDILCAGGLLNYTVNR